MPGVTPALLLACQRYRWLLLWRLTLLSLFVPLENLTAPPPEAKRVAFLSAQPYAHRGLHGRGVIENSPAAFAAALAAGHGIELDVQISRDVDPFVFHDDTLDRLTNESGPVVERKSAQLAAIRLNGTGETIPSLSDVLEMVAGRVPILIEVKSSPISVNAVCLAIRRLLEGYPGPVAVMSFNPHISRWFHDHAPRIVRGLVVTENGARKRSDRIRGAFERTLSLWRAKPDFLAYDVNDLPTSSFAARQRKRGLPVLTWTVRTAADERTAARLADEIIYEMPS
jgi:glycerophosphoryl diester phosphodiesterase